MSGLFDDLARAKRKNPESVMLSYFGSSITYGKCYELVERVSGLLSRFAGKGDVIALDMQNIPQFVISELAAFRIGAIVLPLNPMLTSRELEFYLKDSDAKVVVSQGEYFLRMAEAIQAIGRTIPQIRTDAQAIEELPAEWQRKWNLGRHEEQLLLPNDLPVREESVSEQDVALLVYTSGTTSGPKAAAITHGNLNAASEIYHRWFGVRDSDRFLGIAPFFHITGLVFHIATSIKANSTLECVYRFSPELALQIIEESRSTLTMGVATVYRALLNTTTIRHADLSSMRLWSSGGMAVSKALELEWRNVTGSWIYVAWGLTETTSPATLWPYPYTGELPVYPESEVVSSGIPVYDTRLRILDESGDEVRSGEGEILVAGKQVIHKYWNNPAATSSLIKGEWLRTGDIGTIREGWVYVIDRLKDVINASGYKVWPREIEEILLQHPSVEEVAVIGVPDSYRGESVKAFIKLRPGNQPARGLSEELAAYCKDRLAAYKVPRAIEFVKEVPKTATGKIMKRALRLGK